MQCLAEYLAKSRETRRSRPGPLRLAGMMLGMSPLGGCGQPEGAMASVVDYEGPFVEVPVQPLARAGTLDGIAATDFLVAPDATLHVVWRARTEDT